MRVAIVCSNYFNIAPDTANGTAIFAHSFIKALHARASSEGISVTAYGAGDSDLPVEVRSVAKEPLSADTALIESGRHFLFEQALLSKAFSKQDDFDVYHVNIGDGDIALPFAPFVKKPVIVTLHHMIDTDFIRRYFSLMRPQNVHFISASDAQRKIYPGLQYLDTIYHGIDEAEFSFSDGGEAMMWAGRAIPEKGPHIAVDVAASSGLAINLFGIPRKTHHEWLETNVLQKCSDSITYTAGLNRPELIQHFGSSKLLLMPIQYEESFGLVFIEALSCGTPVVAFARGSVPEVVKDGVTGFIVNESDTEKRGDWIIKRTGEAGLREAVERIYALSAREYQEMRRACREHVTKNFTINRMVDQYIAAYKKVTS